MRVPRLSTSIMAMLLLAACSSETPIAEQPVLVRTFTVGEPLIQKPQAGLVAPAPARTSASQAFSEVAGEVLEILVSAGDRVIAGQALVRIDPRDIQLADSSAKVQVQAARAELAAAEADFARYTELKDKRFISQAEWERRRAMLELSRARFEAGLEQLGVSSIRALQSATVASVSARVGEPVNAGQLLIRLTPDRPTGAAASQPSLGQRGREIVIPVTALIDGQSVMKVVEISSERYQVQRQSVRIGRLQDHEVQVLEGLAPGDQIVAVGAHLLSAGQAVRLSKIRER